MLIMRSRGGVALRDGIVFGRQDAEGRLLKSRLVSAFTRINRQRFSATFDIPDTAKPARGGLLWVLKWWSRGDLINHHNLLFNSHFI